MRWTWVQSQHQTTSHNMTLKKRDWVVACVRPCIDGAYYSRGLKQCFPNCGPWTIGGPWGSDRGSAGNYCFLVEFREKICKFLYTVISKYVLLKSILFLFINTSSEADNMLSFYQPESSPGVIKPDDVHREKRHLEAEDPSGWPPAGGGLIQAWRKRRRFYQSPVVKKTAWRSI